MAGRLSGKSGITSTGGAAKVLLTQLAIYMYYYDPILRKRRLMRRYSWALWAFLAGVLIGSIIGLLL